MHRLKYILVMQERQNLRKGVVWVMKGKKLLAVVLACALFAGAAVITSAAELDMAWYLAQNPDVAVVTGGSPEMLKAHYELFGRKEARMANEHDIEARLRKLFKAEEYAALYPDARELCGDDAEAMFEHYITFGLLEARRPSERVSEAVALSLKMKVEKALKDADIMVQPGCAQLMEIITGTISADVGGKKMQKALAQAAPMVEQAVVEAVEETENPKPMQPVPGGGAGTQSVSSSSAVIPDRGMDGPDTASVTVAKADWAPLADHSTSSGEELKAELNKVNEAMENHVETAAHGAYDDITVVTFNAADSAAIPKHTNVNGDTAYFFGIETPYNGEEYTYNWGFTSGKEEDEESAAIAAVNADFSESKGKTAADGENAAFYWGLTTEKPETDRWGYLAVKDGGGAVVAKYILDFTELSFDHSEQ